MENQGVSPSPGGWLFFFLPGIKFRLDIVDRTEQETVGIFDATNNLTAEGGRR
jgi:hypothetical protein